VHYSSYIESIKELNDGSIIIPAGMITTYTTHRLPNTQIFLLLNFQQLEILSGLKHFIPNSIIIVLQTISVLHQ
jgi:hypothetical protein